MKKSVVIFAFVVLVAGLAVQMRTVRAAQPVSTDVPAEKMAEIEFDSIRVNLGTFSEKDGVQKCFFGFTNVGNAPLIISQAIASCGCTVPTYTKDPVKPGERGQINITYTGKYPGPFTKTITIRSNAKTAIVRLTIVGEMTK